MDPSGDPLLAPSHFCVSCLLLLFHLFKLSLFVLYLSTMHSNEAIYTARLQQRSDVTFAS